MRVERKPSRKTGFRFSNLATKDSINERILNKLLFSIPTTPFKDRAREGQGGKRRSLNITDKVARLLLRDAQRGRFANAVERKRRGMDGKRRNCRNRSIRNRQTER